MTGSPWSAEFERVLRGYLPLHGPDARLRPDDSLADLGLDSMATVGLLVDVEEEFGIALADDDLTDQTFASPAALWAVVDRLRGASR
ncbi:acyl carrier protein [Actinokineospora globicatena]|uniref:acyl carrier protein n=1 Tax=Actinokineospora globicatena TaxID=103729 RepID=UPI0020A4446A|nr:phosphopantetheine-binding protein [Actinokineospora globicatena]MCP2303908.1 acyl carrier protein [Actinokineospora globicatena]GLW78932.1 hypothetical protein Aglo01_34140 [Actinokineospora globicatena]GLW86656.1 hypothetical protein Aglo02_42950 [Actinokineospora globicatena]